MSDLLYELHVHDISKGLLALFHYMVDCVYNGIDIFTDLVLQVVLLVLKLLRLLFWTLLLRLMRLPLRVSLYDQLYFRVTISWRGSL